MPTNIQIPLNSPVDFASYEKITSPNNEVAFSKKESLFYRNCLSNIRKTEETGFTTTNGNLIAASGNTATYKGIDLGIDLSTGVFVKNKRELPTNFPGKIYAASIIKDGILVIFSKSDSQGYVSYYDKDFTLINTNTYPLTPSFGIHDLKMPVRRLQGSGIYDTREVSSDYFISITWTDNVNLEVKVEMPELAEEKYTEVLSDLTATFTFPDITDIDDKVLKLYSFIGERLDVVAYKTIDANNEEVAIAFDDTDQRKRCTFVVKTTLANGKVNPAAVKDIPYFGTVGLVDGVPVLTGEPIPINLPIFTGDFSTEDDRHMMTEFTYSKDVLYPFRFEKNGVISWIITSDFTKNPEQEYNSGGAFYVHEKNNYRDNFSWHQNGKHGRFQDNVFFISMVQLDDNVAKLNNYYQSERYYANKMKWKTDRVPTKLYVVSTPYPYNLGNMSSTYWQPSNTRTFNPFPTGVVYSNISENKGKYWDYGEGWYRILNFTWMLWLGTLNDHNARYDIVQLPLTVLQEKALPTDTVNFQVADACGKKTYNNLGGIDFNDNEYRRTWTAIGTYVSATGSLGAVLVFPYGTNNSIQKNNYEMPTLSNILGGNNTEGWMMSLPFSSETSVKNVRSQWYRGLKIAHTYEGNHEITTVLSTPGDELERPLSIIHYKDNKTTVLDGNIIYTISPAGNDPSKDLGVEKISDYMFKLNILNLPNLILEHSDGSFSLVSSFDGYAMPSKVNIARYELLLPPPGSDTNNVFIFASGYNQEKFEANPSASFLFPYTQVPFYLDSADSLYFNKMCKDIKEPIIDVALTYPTQRDDRPIDVYYSHLGIGTIPEYQYTLREGGEDWKNLHKIYDVDKAGFIWETTAEEMYFPIGIASILKSQNYITPTVQLSSDYSIRLLNRNNQTYMIFNNSARTYKGQVIFTIYGGNYTYDGQGIYYIGSGNDYSQSQFVCYALGFKFLANSGSEAYFYSPWEKRLFIFTGSNTLQADESYSSLGEVVDSLFSSNEQTLYLLFDTEEKDRRVLVAKTPNDTSTLSVSPDAKLATSSKGVIVYNDVELLADQTSQTLSPSVGDLVPFKVETEYIGDPATLYKFSYIDLLFYGIKKDISFTVTYDVINGITKTTETKEINLKAADWKAESYRYTFTPTHMMGNSCRIGIKSDDELYLSYIGIGIDEASTNPTAPRTKGK